MATAGEGVTWTVTVQQGKEKHQVELPQGAKVEALLAELERRTGTFVRQMKVICKGKVLTETPGATLASVGVTAASKLMLLVNAGGEKKAASAGQAALAAKRADAAQDAARRKAARGAEPAPKPAAGPPPGSTAQRAQAWARTGLVALRDAGLASVPPEVWAVTHAKVLDLGGNALAALPPELAGLGALQRLRLAGNRLESLPGAACASLRSLTVLSLERNMLTALPAELGELAALRMLYVDGNRLAALPPELARCAALERLTAADNALEECPACLAGCASLAEVDLSRNRISRVAPELGGAPKLRALLLDGNRVAAVPPELLRGAENLQTLSLHQNPLTVEQLRETEGFAEFDARRQAKYTKQIRTDVMIDRDGFDEGADTPDFRRWGGSG